MCVQLTVSAEPIPASHIYIYIMLYRERETGREKSSGRTGGIVHTEIERDDDTIQ